MAKVAALAQVAEVIFRRVGVGWVVLVVLPVAVQVGHGEHHFGAGDRVGFSVGGPAFREAWRALAAVARAPAYVGADFGPVMGILFVVYGHN